MLTEGQLVADLAVAADDLDLGHAVSQLQRRLEAVGQSTLDTLAQHETVDDHLDRVVLVPSKGLVLLEELVDVDDVAVDTGTHETLSGEVLEQRLVLALAAAHDRRQDLEAGALVHHQDPVDDLLRGLALKPGAVVDAVLHSDARVQQAQVVVDLGDRADRRARVAAGRFLIDRNGR